jgi:hypothetical protein
VSTVATAFPATGWDAAAYATLAVGVLALVGVLVTAVVALVTSNRATQARADNDRRERWWERAQWAMERACDPDPTKRAVGLTVLASLGKSDLASPDEQVMLAQVALSILTGGSSP